MGRLLLEAARVSRSRVCEALRARGHEALGFAHSSLISNLDEEGTRLSTLAERAGLTKQAMGALARDVEAAGYVERQSDPTDARAVLLVPTARGRVLMSDLRAEMGRVEDEMRQSLGDAEMATLRRCLELLASHRSPTDP